MKRRTTIAAVAALVIPAAGWCADPARHAMDNGARLYENESYEQAARQFDEAARSAPREKLDPAVARFNQGNALLKHDQPDKASQTYADALRSPNLALQTKAYFNRGNALVAMARQEEAKGGLDTASRALDEALAMYENSMALASQDEDPKVNYELALKQKEQLEQKKQQQQEQQQPQKDQPKDQEKQDQQQNQQAPQQEQPENQQEQENRGQQDRQNARERAQPPKSSEAMTPEDAAMVLDAMKQEEQAKREQMKLIIGQPAPVEKDW